MELFTKEELLDRICAARKPREDAGLSTALIIAASALYDKKLRDGRDYLYHLLDVSSRRYSGSSDDKRIVSILHDVVEDSDWTLEDLRRAGFTNRIINAVDAVTKREDEEYFDFIQRGSTNSLGIDVKLADLKDNSDMSRNIVLLTPGDVERTNKYIVAKEYLVAIKRKRIVAGTSIVDFIKSRPELYDHQLMLANSLEYRSRQDEFSNLRDSLNLGQ